jgi:uncharacterized protein
LSLPVVTASPKAVELSPAPLPSDWIIEGTPHAVSARLAQSADRTSSVVTWTCTAGRFHWHYTVDETLYVTDGEVHVTDEKGKVRRLVAGDVAYFPAGSHSIWYVPETMTKIAFCRHSMPLMLGFALRAWNKLVRIVTGSSASSGLVGAAPVPSERVRATAA